MIWDIQIIHIHQVTQNNNNLLYQFLKMSFIPVYSVDSENIIPRILTAEVSAAIQSVRFIANHIKNADADNEVSFVNINLLS